MPEPGGHQNARTTHRQRVHAYLRINGPATVIRIADVLGVSAIAVRNAMHPSGPGGRLFREVGTVIEGPGRPKKVWDILRDATPQPPPPSVGPNQ